MRSQYFRHRRLFDFSKDTHDIGHPLPWKKAVEDNHFLYRLFKKRESDYPAFYHYHLDFFLSRYADASEREFFQHVRRIVTDMIAELRVKGRYKSSHSQDMRNRMQLEEFIKYLESIDQWQTSKTKEVIVADQAEEIKRLKSEVEQLKVSLKEARKLETEDYISIRAGYTLTLCDILLQLQELPLPEGNDLLYPANQITWRRMICKFFRDGDKAINFESIHRYFPADRKNPGRKYAPIPPEYRLFKVVPNKKRA